MSERRSPVVVRDDEVAAPTRWVVVGAGAVGGAFAARLAAGGSNVLLVARGAHGDAIRREGLRVRTPGGDDIVALDTVACLSAWRPRAGDAVVIAVKGPDTPGVLEALRRLEVLAPRDGPALCFAQNGVANERVAIERGVPAARVHGVMVEVPATFLEPGMVGLWAHPVPGVVRVGRWRGGVDAVDEALAAGLRGGGFLAEVDAEVAALKRAKLLGSLGGIVQALAGTLDDSRLGDLLGVVREEARRIFRVARQQVHEARHQELRAGVSSMGTLDGRARPGGATWQSLARRTGRLETAWLNGDVAALGASWAVPAPFNHALCELAVEAASWEGPGELGVDGLLDVLAERVHPE